MIYTRERLFHLVVTAGLVQAPVQVVNNKFYITISTNCNEYVIKL